MNRLSILGIAATTALGLAILSGSVVAQQKPLTEQLVGSWTLVSSDQMRPDVQHGLHSSDCCSISATARRL
jgi:hypothetical protein